MSNINRKVYNVVEIGNAESKRMQAELVNVWGPLHEGLKMLNVFS
jgi:hypothetical protein